MAAIINLLLNERLTAEDLLSWILGDSKNAELEGFDHLRQTFIPLFLNYLRDQTCSFLQSTTNSGLTPSKGTPSLKAAKRLSTKKKINPQEKDGKNSSKTKLDFSDSFISTFESKSSINQNERIPSHGQNRNTFSPIQIYEGSASKDHNNPSSCLSKKDDRFQREFPALNSSMSLLADTSSKQAHSDTSKSANVSLPPQSASWNDDGFQREFPNLGSGTFHNNCLSSKPQTDTLSPLSPVYSTIPTPKNKKFSPINTSTPGRSSAQVDLSSYLKRRSFDGSLVEGRLSDQKVNLSEFVIERKKGRKRNIPKKTSSEKISEENVSNDPEMSTPIRKNVQKEIANKKRINPTLVSSVCSSTDALNTNNSNSLTPSNRNQPNSAFTTPREDNTTSVSQDRLQLKQDLKKFSDQETCFGLPNKESPPLLSTVRNISSQDAITPIPTNVSNKRELNILCDVYSRLILCNMVPNLMVELYYLFQLLTVNVNESKLTDDKEIPSYFNSIHNCVYFSVLCLSYIICSLSYLDKATLKLLSENSRISAFNSTLHIRLIEICETCRISRPRPPKSPILSVSFQSETDNRDNFPTEVLFNVFKKQRDLFYQIIRIWEDEHMKANWIFELRLQNKIQEIMFLMKDSSVNMMHFARLFHFQLLAMCKGNKSINSQSDSEDRSIMQLKRERPDKYQRLFERLVQPQKFGGPVPSPSFPGAQEFFYSFIMNACNPTFNCFLRDSVLFRILQLNETSLQIVPEYEENIIYAQDEFCSSLESLRLLAKFLGLLEFLPYQTNGYIPERVIASQISIRSQVIPPLQLTQVLKNAVKSRALVVVLPWVIEYLSMVDPVALHTSYYLTIAFMLIFIHKILYTFQVNPQLTHCEDCFTSKDLSLVNPFNSFYLKILLGWLFSLPNFPEGLFYALDEENEIDHDTYEEFCSLVCCSYTSLCYICIKTQCFNQNCLLDTLNVSNLSGISDFLSPIKKVDSRYVTPKKSANDSRSKIDTSPMKTPSKSFHISTVDTPDITPQTTPQIQRIQSSEGQKKGFDTLPIVTHQILLTCCPYVGELKSLLSEFAFGISHNRGNNIRKITPLSSSNDKTAEQSELSLQLQLEDNFFHNKPSSTKKTVKFVSEMIYSNVLEHLRATLIPALKDNYIQQLKALIPNQLSGTPSATYEKLSEMVEMRTPEMSQELVIKAREGAMQEIERLSTQDQLVSFLGFLLPLETPVSTDMCRKIVRRMTNERIVAWLTSYLHSGLCIKELNSEACKFIKNSIKASNTDNASFSSSMNLTGASQLTASITEEQGAETPNTSTPATAKKLPETAPVLASVHDSSVPAPSVVLTHIKANLRSLMAVDIADKPPQARQEDVLKLLKDIYEVTQKRKDLTAHTFKDLSVFSLEWIVATTVCDPEIISKEVIRRMLELWLPSDRGGIFSFPENDVCFLSARTIMLLGQTPQESQPCSWMKVERFLCEMILNHRLISPNALQGSCIALLQHSWPQNILKGLSTLIKNIFDQLKLHQEFKNDPDVLGLLDWVGWVLEELEE